MSDNPLYTILHPRSVVMAGASNSMTKMGALQALNLIKGDYRGQVFLLHPKDRLVLGHPAWPDPASLPETPDVALLATPTAITLKLLDQLGSIGVRHAVVSTAGFREMGPEGHALEEELLAVAARHGMRFVGPNCIGVLNTHLGLNMTVMPYLDRPGHVGLISQSGTYVTQAIPFLRERGVRLSQAISVGNAASIDLVDCLSYLGDDPETKAIAMYNEGISRGDDFLKVAREVGRRKPIVALYVGGSEAGARSARSHTGSLGGPDAVYQGLFDQAGIIRARTVTHLFLFAQALASQPVPRGPRMAVLTHSGGPAASMADAIETQGLTLPPLSEALQQKLAPHLGPTASARNPVDLTFVMSGGPLVEQIPDILMHSDEIDGLLMHGIMDTGFGGLLYDKVKHVVPLSYEQFEQFLTVDLTALMALPAATGKPLVSSNFLREDHAVNTFKEQGVPISDDPATAVAVMASLYRYGQARQRLQAQPVSPGPRRAGAVTHRGVLNELDSAALMEAYGMPLAPRQSVSTLTMALEAAGQLGYPVVLKALPAGVAHKTEAGLVKLNISSDQALADAFMDLAAKAPGGPFMVAKMIKGSRELVVGMSRHPGVGAFVMLGLGGLFAETLKDVIFRKAPLSDADVAAMAAGLRASSLLGPVRGLPAVDMQSLGDCLKAVSDVAMNHPEVREIDANPVLVTDRGLLMAVDALVVTG